MDLVCLFFFLPDPAPGFPNVFFCEGFSQEKKEKTFLLTVSLGGRVFFGGHEVSPWFFLHFFV